MTSPSPVINQPNSSDTTSLTRKPSLSPTNHPINLHNQPSASPTTSNNSFHPTKRATPSIGLFPNSNSQSPSSPNSIGFGKSSFQTFGRIGDTSQPPSPGLFNNSNNLKKPFHQLTNYAIQQQHPLHHHQNNSNSPAPPNLTNRPRKLGSFNSLAVNLTNQSNHRNKGINNNQNDQQNNQQNSQSNQDDSKSSENELDEENGKDSINGRLKNSLTIQHKLRSKWVFWVLHRSPSKKISEEEFGKAMRRLGSCDTVESFYSLYLHIKRPSNHQPISDIHIFVDPIKPAWEDPSNVHGGKWTIRLKKGLANRLWETLILCLIGGGLEKLISNSSSSPDDNADQRLNKSVQNDHKEICGAVLSIRREEDILAIWHKTGSPEAGADGKMAKQVKLSLQTVLQLPLNCSIIYKLNADCLSSNGVLNGAINNHHQNQNQNQNQIPNHHRHHHSRQQQQNKTGGQDQFNEHHQARNNDNKGNLNRNSTFNPISNNNNPNLTSNNNNEPKIGINFASNHVQFHNQPNPYPGFGNFGNGSNNATSNLKKK